MFILLSGASGFLGTIIKRNLFYDSIASVGRVNSDYNCDLAQTIPTFSQKFDLIIHAAGKAHSVPKTQADRLDFFNVNVDGTANLLKGVAGLPQMPKAFVFISSVSVYGLTTGTLVNEEALLDANDSYGLSKIKAESIVQEWCHKHGVVCSIFRLPLVAGTNPNGNLKSMINGIKRGYYFDIAEGKARKSIVLADDIAKIIPKAAEVGGIYNLTDGHHPSFSELSELIAKQLGQNKPPNIPYWLATIMAKTGDILGSNAPINSDKLLKITSDLTFDDSKARKLLGWNPTRVLEEFKIK